MAAICGKHQDCLSFRACCRPLDEQHSWKRGCQVHCRQVQVSHDKRFKDDPYSDFPRDELRAPTKMSGGGPIAYKIMPAQNPTGKVLKEVYAGDVKPKSAGKVARPPNAFIVYRQRHHADMVAANPGLHNNQICASLTFPIYDGF